jgi:hypothetical protein
VVALGVLHGAAMAEPQRGLHEAYASWLASGAPPDSLVEEIFRELGGAFFARAPLVTPWGEVTAAEPGAEDEWLRERPALLAREFSLDLFLGVLAAAVRAGAVPALPVLPIYVLLTRDPRASFAVARHLAARLPAAEAGRTALVTTGDLVHFGHAYSAPEEMARRPSEEPALTAHFRAEVEAALTLGLGARDYEGFYRRSLAVLGNDQRNVLPVVAERLGPGAAHQLVSFALTDYSRIRGVDRPCVVASALVRYFSTSRQFS